MKNFAAAHVVVALALLAGVSCSDPGAESTAESDAESNTEAGADAVANDVADTAAVAAFVKAWIPGKNTGLVTGPYAALGKHSGDVILENKHARYVIRGAPTGIAMYGTAGGMLVDAIALKDGKPWRGTFDHLRELVLAFDSHQVRADNVTITKDGKDGIAEVTVTGALLPMPQLADTLGHDKPPVIASHTYRLRPDSAALEMRTKIRTDTTIKAGKKVPLMVAEIALWGAQRRLFLPGFHDHETPTAANLDTIGFSARSTSASDSATGAALASTKKLLMIDAGAFRAFLHPNVEATKEGVELVRYFAIGGPGFADAAAAMDVVRKAAGVGSKSRRIAGKIVGSSADFVDAVDAKGKPLVRCAAVGGNQFDCPVPLAATHMRAGTPEVANAVALPKSGKDTADKTPTHLDLPGPKAARLLVKAEIPVRITLRPRTKTGKPGPKHLRRTIAAFPGPFAVDVGPGDYDVFVHHGPFYSQHHEVISAKAGAQTTVTAKLVPRIDTGTWLAADLHVHAEPSPDSEVAIARRIEGALADGLSYFVHTDHDHVTATAPWYVQNGIGTSGPKKGTCGTTRYQYGTASWELATAPGVEVTTMQDGHWNVWPAAKPFAWHGKKHSELFDLFASDKQVRVVQCNHPASDSFSYFTAIDFDAKTTPKDLLRCDLVEVINGFEPEKTAEVLTEWLELLRRGVKWTATGASDCHKTRDFIGNPRTLVRFEQDPGGDACKRTAKHFDEHMLAGRALATSGPFVTVTATAGTKTAQIGDTLDAKNLPVSVTATVQLVDWIQPGTVEVYVDGKLTQTSDLAKTPVEDGKRTLVIAVNVPAPKNPTGEEQFVVVVHRPGKKPTTSPGIRVPPWAITNPVWIRRK